MDKPKDGKLTFIKVARMITYLAYAYAIIATVFLVLGFVLLLFGANSSTGFVSFVYNIAAQFLKPFREIFPGQSIGNRSYFSAAGLFAIIMYGIAAAAIHSLISYLTVKEAQHQEELEEIQARRRVAAQNQSQQPNRYSSTRQPVKTQSVKPRI